MTTPKHEFAQITDHVLADIIRMIKVVEGLIDRGDDETGDEVLDIAERLKFFVTPTASPLTKKERQ